MDIRQVTETIAMIEEQNFDIRTITCLLYTSYVAFVHQNHTKVKVSVTLANMFVLKKVKLVNNVEWLIFNHQPHYQLCA